MGVFQGHRPDVYVTDVFRHITDEQIQFTVLLLKESSSYTRTEKTNSPSILQNRLINNANRFLFLF